VFSLGLFFPIFFAHSSLALPTDEHKEYLKAKAQEIKYELKWFMEGGEPDDLEALADLGLEPPTAEIVEAIVVKSEMIVDEIKKTGEMTVYQSLLLEDMVDILARKGDVHVWRATRDAVGDYRFIPAPGFREEIAPKITAALDAMSGRILRYESLDYYRRGFERWQVDMMRRDPNRVSRVKPAGVAVFAECVLRLLGRRS
jgi:hypothetical protein